MEHTGISRTDLLKNAFSFHCSQIDPILEQFRSLAESAVLSRPSVPVASILYGSILSETGVFSPYMADQIYNKQELKRRGSRHQSRA